jgi:electron transport complex protein RnfE
MNQWQNFTKGFIRENPTFSLILGMCPTLGVSSSASNGIGMGLATTFVLVMSNLVISLLKNLIPNKVRIAAFIVVIASFVTIVDLVMAGFVPALHERLGIFIPLIVVNCIVLGRAEAFAQKNSIGTSVIDGLGMGFGFTMALLILGSIRESIGNGSIFGHKFIEGDGILLFILSPGAFITLGLLIALINHLRTGSKTVSS